LNKFLASLLCAMSHGAPGYIGLYVMSHGAPGYIGLYVMSHGSPGYTGLYAVGRKEIMQFGGQIPQLFSIYPSISDMKYFMSIL